MAETKKDKGPAGPKEAIAPASTKPEKPAEKKGETEAKKQAKKPAGKKPKKPGIYSLLEKNLGLLAVIVGIAIIAGALAVVSLPEEATVEDFWKNRPEAQLKMIIVTSERCPSCEEGNSLEQLFKANGINYSTSKFEESTVDGQGLIQTTGAKKLPAFIIEGKSLSDSMLVKTKSGIAPLRDVLHFYVAQGKGTYKEGIFAFREMNLDSVIRTSVLLQEPCGNEENFLVQLFADPYDPNTISRSRDFENLRLFLEGHQDINVSFRYNYLPTYSRILQDAYLQAFGGKPETVERNLQGPAKHLICANEFGTEKFNLVQQSLYETYCEISAEDMAAQNPRPLWNCSDSNHFGWFLTADELVEASEKAGIYNQLAFSACLYNVPGRLEAMEQLAALAGIERTPTVLVNCQYEVPLDKVRQAICTINEDLRFCWET